MNGRKIYQFAVQRVPEYITSSINKINLKLENIDIFLCHQANQRILDSVAEKLGVSKDRFPSNMSKYGNTSAASIPLVWSENLEILNKIFEENNKNNKQTIISVSGFGAGLTIGSLIWKYNTFTKYLKN